MNNRDSIIFIIDDDEAVRRSLSLLLRSAGYEVVSYPDAGAFLKEEKYRGTGCVLLDIFLDGTSGLELQDEINGAFGNLPVIYITGRGDVPMSVRAFRQGALNFLQKPVEEDELFKAVQEACEISRNRMEDQAELDRIRPLINSLTPREKDVFRYVIKGFLNKQIAAELRIKEHTVKLHRGLITRKLGVKSVAELVLLAEKIRFS